MNAPAPPSLALRLEKVLTDRLRARLAEARFALYVAQTPIQRAKAVGEIDALRSELLRRGIAA